ncbi:PREDICTED: putative methyltransferase DDB_G0268948 [Camelina sativa]|uniref:Methyltransferase DDB_G0268948 n=1 Tax=Camelina sativa TaxID=90675 RepID=A0ABM0TIY3_CAMSA|nr:PREDICTED: putative methyltransferase DDB_G0268948 [Camelina sativa]
MAALSENEAKAYLDARPRYPIDWYKKIAARTQDHKLAWDVGTGNGQAAIGLVEHYENVVATDINEAQLKRAIKHSRISYHHTPITMSEDEMVALIGGENSVDLIVAAQAVHFFDLTTFYNVAKRVLRKEGGLIAVWVYNDIVISPEIDPIMKRLVDSTLPFRTPIMNLASDGYKTLMFPFESIGMGSEGKPITLDIPHKLSLKGFIGFLRSWQPAMKAKEKGVELINEDLMTKFEEAWGDENQVKDVFYKAHMIVGKIPEVKCESDQVLSEDSKKDLLLPTEVGRKQERRQPSDEGNIRSKKQNTSEDEA